VAAGAGGSTSGISDVGTTLGTPGIPPPPNRPDTSPGISPPLPPCCCAGAVAPGAAGASVTWGTCGAPPPSTALKMPGIKPPPPPWVAPGTAGACESMPPPSIVFKRGMSPLPPSCAGADETAVTRGAVAGLGGAGATLAGAWPPPSPGIGRGSPGRLRLSLPGDPSGCAAEAATASPSRFPKLALEAKATGLD